MYDSLLAFSWVTKNPEANTLRKKLGFLSCILYYQHDKEQKPYFFRRRMFRYQKTEASSRNRRGNYILHSFHYYTAWQLRKHIPSLCECTLLKTPWSWKGKQETTEKKKMWNMASYRGERVSVHRILLLHATLTDTHALWNRHELLCRKNTIIFRSTPFNSIVHDIVHNIINFSKFHSATVSFFVSIHFGWFSWHGQALWDDEEEWWANIKEGKKREHYSFDEKQCSVQSVKNRAGALYIVESSSI